jgi:hypothetical protein
MGISLTPQNPINEATQENVSVRFPGRFNGNILTTPFFTDTVIAAREARIAAADFAPYIVMEPETTVPFVQVSPLPMLEEGLAVEVRGLFVPITPTEN